MIFPPVLKPGDTIGIVAPARKLSPGQLEPALKVLKTWGLKTLLGKNIFSTSHSYLAGNDDQRREDVQDMIDNKEVKAIFSARGGYGSTRIIEEVDFSPLKSSPKWIVGFSDVTAFHMRLIALGIASIHGTMPIFFGKTEAQDSVESLREILFGGACNIDFVPEESNRMGQCRGEVIGGNLSLIVDAFKTTAEPDTRNRILVVEEVDEYFYKLDRMFTQLRRTGKLKDLAGLVIGHMTDIKNSELDFGETVQQIVRHAVRDYQYPVAFSFPSGHCNPNMAWIHGGEAMLDVSMKKSSLIYSRIHSAKP